MKPGTRGEIIAGPFARLRSTSDVRVIEDLGKRLRVQVDLSERPLSFLVKRKEFRPKRKAKDPTPFIWARIQDAIRRRLGIDLEELAWWEARAQRAAKDENLLGLLEEFRAHQSLLEAQVATECAQAERAFRDAFDPLSPSEKRKRWKAEEDQWVEVKEARQNVIERLAREHPHSGPNLVQGQLARRRAETFAHQERLKLYPLAAPDPRTAPMATSPELEAAIDRDPDADDAYLVYGDFLLGQGDPRGDLIGLQSGDDLERPDIAAASQRLLESHGPYFLGALADHPHEIEIDWKRGFMESVTIGGEGLGHELVATLLALPSARYLRKISIESLDEYEFPGVIECLIEHRPRHLRALRLGYDDDELERSFEVDAGDIAELLRALPDLEELALRAGQVEMGEVKLPRLRSLHLETLALRHSVLARLAETSWPSLEDLELWFGPSSAGATIEAHQVAPLLSGRSMPKLKMLGLENAEFADELCSQLLAAPLVPRLEGLSLAMGTMSDDGAEALSFGGFGKVFKKLRMLDVRNNYLTSAGRKKLAKLGPVLIDRPQRKPSPYDVNQTRRVVFDPEFDPYDDDL